MNHSLSWSARKLNKKRRLRKGWQAVVRTLAAMVVFCTTYVLILPAITMEEAPVCGYEEHVHEEACYAEPQRMPTRCGLSAEAVVIHQHSDLCWDTAGLICTLPEQTVHIHDDECHTREMVLSCIMKHIHSEACVNTEQILVCEIPESEGHAHSESCSGTKSVQICTAEVHEHREDCFEEQTLVCEIPESEEHAHNENCTGTKTVLICTADTHTHGEGCFEEQTQICEIPEAESHAHSESCFTITGIPCTQPTAQDHAHEDGCYQQVDELSCDMQELQLHSHGENCHDVEGNLSCKLPAVVEHIHTESCLVAAEDAEPSLACMLQEHTHTLACYPLEEEETLAIEYHCGHSVHTHNENCYHNDGTMVCTIPEHTHEAACAVQDLDLTADMEWPAIWEAEIADLEFTGVWAEDLLTVAESQLGYTESKRNCILKNDQLLGYTRYADWYGKYYGEWDDMFVAFCLHYADIPEENLPHASDTAEWIEALKEKEMFTPAGDYTPVPGDLIFWDSDADAVADKSGIVSECTGAQEIKVITGDTAQKRVDTLTFGEEDIPKVVGYCALPMSPMSQEQWQAAEDVSTLLAALPEANTVTETLQKLNDDGDKAGYDALQQEVSARIEAVKTAYDALTEAQQARVTGLERLAALQEVCDGESWQQFAVLTDDSAVLIQLNAGEPEVISAPAEGTASEETSPEEAEEEEGQQTPVIPENTVRSGDTILYPVTGTAESYYTDICYGEARVKIEFVLPMTADKAAFDLQAMPWLEEAALTTVTRTINETETACQVLIGYRKLAADEISSIVIPGSFTETAVVKVLGANHGEEVSLIISAAMEHNTWDGICQNHETEEKLSVITESFTVYRPQDPTAQLANYNAFALEAEKIAAQELSDSDQYFAAQELMRRIADCYNAGGLSEEQLDALAAVIAQLSDVNLNTIAEPCVGNNWMNIDFGELISYGTENIVLSNNVQILAMKAAPAMSAAVYSTVFPSDQQIREEGGSNTSADGAVQVSKTIEGTDTENVFDITLQIITKDEVNEVYKDPDMAVVVVMDISNTMRSNFGNITRYQAAMTAGENFLKKFAQQNSTLSRVGYVAFNTDAHEIFNLTACNTTAQANSLTSIMKSETGAIVNKYVDANGKTTSYYDSKRFTNMQAGLKMASDMLADANNQHKYIIFISDGFPTTYLKSGYEGYDPNTPSGLNNTNGVFYDAVRGVHCDYGTSYSDTAAIKARQLAVTLKNQGVNIFSIGVDVGGQNLWDYHNHEGGMTGGFSVVERRQNADYYNSTGYEIGTKHAMISKSSVTSAEKTAMAQDFKDWLKGSTTTGIGSGYYYDSTNLSGLNAAYDTIFAKILELNASSSHLDWVATDPMPDMGVHEIEAMEFISFWDLNENGDWVLVSDDLTGESKDGNLYDNTADFHEDTQTIHWDIKKSGYVSQQVDNTTTYVCELKYRIRLKNEADVFEERLAYDTNDVTTLTYRIIEVEGEKTSISERRTINFPIPAVEGYLSELSFKKIEPSGAPLAGAKFQLQHDSSCSVCRGDGKNAVSIAKMEETSGEDGIVTFERIPSGHTYLLTETEAPDSYIKTENQYKVVISYDTQTVTVLDKDGNELEQTWDQKNPTIKNDVYYELPNTGGMGTSHLTFGGSILIVLCLVYSYTGGRKRQKGGW